jgi:6-pyruvoyltetrahydropterin/6-carboxytetrahydropterin synthase
LSGKLMPTEIHVSEYIQVAHRLIELPGKCQQIHGHSMHIVMYLKGQALNGYLHFDQQVLDFSAVKNKFRQYLKTNYDHHLLLNEADCWAQPFYLKDHNEGKSLPGLVTRPGDPTVENIAKWIFDDMAFSFPVSRVEVEETATNGVSYCA